MLAVALAKPQTCRKWFQRGNPVIYETTNPLTIHSKYSDWPTKSLLESIFSFAFCWVSLCYCGDGAQGIKARPSFLPFSQKSVTSWVQCIFTNICLLCFMVMNLWKTGVENTKVILCITVHAGASVMEIAGGIFLLMKEFGSLILQPHIEPSFVF